MKQTISHNRTAMAQSGASVSLRCWRMGLGGGIRPAAARVSLWAGTGQVCLQISKNSDCFGVCLIEPNANPTHHPSTKTRSEESPDKRSAAFLWPRSTFWGVRCWRIGTGNVPAAIIDSSSGQRIETETIRFARRFLCRSDITRKLPSTAI